LILIAAAIAGGSAFFVTRRQPAVYQSRTTLMIGNTISETNPNPNDFSAAYQLAVVYADLLTREPFQQVVKAKLGLDFLPDYTARATDYGMVEISVFSNNPELAQIVAKEFADQLILQSPTTLKPEEKQRQETVQQELNYLETKIKETRADIVRSQQELSNMVSANQIAAAQEKIGALESKLSGLQTTYANLLASSRENALNTLTIFEPAALPVAPIPSRANLIVMLAALSGAVLAAGAAYLIEILDNTIKNPEEIRSILPFPVLGYIGELERDKSGVVLSVADRPLSPVSEGFRSLRTNLEFVGVDRPLRTVLVTSANPGDGKTSVAMNLAIMMAQSEKRVILLDADMRRPAMHRALGIPNREGLSDLFRGHVGVDEVARVWRNDRLKVVTSGTVPPNPTELLSSNRMDQILLNLQDAADIIIIDSPPFFVADSWVLASKVDGVLLVVRPGYTRRNMIRNLLEQIKRINAKVIGVALNRMANPQGAYSASSYMSYYYSIETDKASQTAAMGGGRRRRTLQSVLRTLQKPAERPSQPGRPVAELPEAMPNGHGKHHLEVLPPTPETPPQTERSRASLEVLYAISRELATQMDVGELMQRILKMTLESVGATSGSIIVLNDKGNALEGVLIYEGKVQKQDADQLAEVVEKGLAGWVIQNKRPAVLDNTHTDERWLRRGADQNDHVPRSAVSVPLMTHERVVGVLTLVHPNVGHFTRDDLSMLTAIAVGVSSNSKVYSN
jgi:capsular exopolysaccharide synthesis family protein